MVGCVGGEEWGRGDGEVFDCCEGGGGGVVGGRGRGREEGGYGYVAVVRGFGADGGFVGGNGLPGCVLDESKVRVG